jgi:hypothetical protein
MYEFGGCYKMDNEQVITQTGMNKSQIESLYSGFQCESGESPLHSLSLTLSLAALSSIEMANGWYHHPHRETRMEFEARAIHLADWMWSLLSSQPVLPSHEIRSTATAVFVLHGYLLTAILNQILFSKPNACVFIHANTGMTHLEFIEFKSGARGCSVKYQNALPHLHGREADLKSGDDLVRDQWVKIYQ